MSQLNFDATQVEPSQDFSPVPAGEYLMAVTESEMKTTKSGTGAYLQMTLQVIDGQFKGRLVWERLNLQNPNQQAVDIARRTLSSICHAVGKLQVQDSAELHNLPMLVKVSVRPADGQYDASNDIKAYKSANGPATPSPQVAAVPPQPAAPAPQATAPGSVPW